MKRICKKCNEEKDIEMFSKASQCDFGRTWTCNKCVAASKRLRYLDNREKEIARCTKWNKENPAKVAANMAKSRARNYEAYKANYKRWRRENKDKIKIYDHKKRIRRKYAIAFTKEKISFDEWISIIKSQDSKCYYCKIKDRNLEIEHVIPLSRGGDHSKGNIVGACAKCNSRKQAIPPEKWAKKIGRLFI